MECIFQNPVFYTKDYALLILAERLLLHEAGVPCFHTGGVLVALRRRQLQLQHGSSLGSWALPRGVTLPSEQEEAACRNSVCRLSLESLKAELRLNHLSPELPDFVMREWCVDARLRGAPPACPKCGQHTLVCAGLLSVCRAWGQGGTQQGKGGKSGKGKGFCGFRGSSDDLPSAAWRQLVPMEPG